MTETTGTWGVKPDPADPIGTPQDDKTPNAGWIKVVQADTGISRESYQDRRSQRGMREIIAVWLIALFFLVIGLAFTTLFLDDDPTLIDKRFQHLKSLLDVIIGPVATLLSSAIGFYFGIQATQNKSGQGNADT
jgi:hypothetical protein